MPAPMPIGALTMASFAVTAIVIGNAYYQKKQFYPSVVYITKSNPCMAAIYLLGFTLVILLGKLLKKIFFGQLRAAEFEHLVERSFYAVTETCLAFTVFRDDFSPKFVAFFTVLLFLKAFHWLAEYRVDFMERSPVITFVFHVRVTSLLLLLSLLDLILVSHACHSTLTRGASVQLVFGFEYAILLTVCVNIAIKYLCHTVDLQSENPWENKAVYLLYTELLLGFVKVVLYAIFLVIMIRIHTFPLFIIRPMYLTMRAFKKALNDVILSRRAIRNMNTLYPDATPDELAAVDNVCIICREEMVTEAKKLPCGHIFHASCLRSWFQRQQTCPTCRMDILRQPPTALPQQQPQQQQPAPAAPAAVRQQVLTPAAAAAQPAQMQQPRFAFPHPQQVPAGAAALPPFPPFPFLRPHNTENQRGPTPAEGVPAHPNPFVSGFAGNPFMIPPFPMTMPFGFPLPPPPPTNFGALTEAELRALEGHERKHVQARILALRNIQTLLDAAVLQMSQYSSIVATLQTMAPPGRGDGVHSGVERNPTDGGAQGPEGQTTEPVGEAVGGEASSISGMTSGAVDERPLTDVSSSTGDEVPVEGESDEIRRRRLDRFVGQPHC